MGPDMRPCLVTKQLIETILRESATGGLSSLVSSSPHRTASAKWRAGEDVLAWEDIEDDADTRSQDTSQQGVTQKVARAKADLRRGDQRIATSFCWAVTA